jgi:hypothetical protein
MLISTKKGNGNVSFRDLANRFSVLVGFVGSLGAHPPLVPIASVAVVS